MACMTSLLYLGDGVIHGLCGVNVYIGDICMMLTYLGYGVILGLVDVNIVFVWHA